MADGLNHATPPRADKETPVTPDGTLTARAAVLDELRRLRGRLPFVDGSIVASTDGLIIAHDISATQAYGVEPEGVAALSAVNLGLSQRVVDTANHGTLRETIIRGTFGQVVTYPAGERALLTVIVGDTTDVEELHGPARQSANRVCALLAEFLVDPV
jgi:predicted regulator of Ras-like GTPase activity (Roadblock/LC7/MglB family)